MVFYTLWMSQRCLINVIFEMDYFYLFFQIFQVYIEVPIKGETND